MTILKTHVYSSREVLNVIVKKYLPVALVSYVQIPQLLLNYYRLITIMVTKMSFK